MYAEAKAKVALPVQTVWNRLSDLRSLSQWASDVAASPAEPLRPGATRWARLYEPTYGKDVLIERITHVDVDRHRFTYDIEGGIGPLSTIRTTWRVLPDAGGSGSIVICSSELTITGPARFLSFLVLRRWTKQLQSLVDGFARWAKSLEGDAEFMEGPEQPPEPSFLDATAEMTDAELDAEPMVHMTEAPAVEMTEAEPMVEMTETEPAVVKRVAARPPAKSKGRSKGTKAKTAKARSR
jgi:hypothetical protein